MNLRTQIQTLNAQRARAKADAERADRDLYAELCARGNQPQDGDAERMLELLARLGLNDSHLMVDVPAATRLTALRAAKGLAQAAVAGAVEHAREEKEKLRQVEERQRRGEAGLLEVAKRARETVATACNAQAEAERALRDVLKELQAIQSDTRGRIPAA
jgi:hypothetical protein